MASSSTSSDNLIQTLTKRGWCLRDTDHIKALIATEFPGESTAVVSVESKLCNMDLRSIGGKSLPDPSLLRKSAHFDGPKVLQVSSARDISRSSIAESSGSSNSRRLLRLKLTDGHSDITAIEYTHIPSIPDNIVPGTKIRLENKVIIHNGILCLNAKAVTVLGGIVQSLYDEWEMNLKYSGFTCSTLKSSHDGATDGPPPFEKLQAGASSRRVNQENKYFGKGTSSGSLETSRLRASDLKANSKYNDVKSDSLIEKTEENRPAPETRPKEVAEFAPVQNQAAAQKLLQKMNNPDREERHSRGGWKQRGRGMQEESAVLTLDEWERKRAGGSSSTTRETTNVSRDEDLARQLQQQFDLEDLRVPRGPHVTEADNIRMSMFSFDREDPGAQGSSGFRGRGRGRGRGGRGRGRGRGRGG